MSQEVLLVDDGARGHALAWKLCQSPQLGKLYIASGNAGTKKLGENVPIKVTDIKELLKFARKKNIGLTVVGQDDSLALGIVDAFMAHGLAVFGPTRAADEIEASKAFSKRFMGLVGVPTAPCVIYTDYFEALAFVRRHFSVVGAQLKFIKANGLARGKGAYPCTTLAKAEEALNEIMIQRIYGSAGDAVIIEDFVDGEEISIHAFCDGVSFELFPSSRDHKAIFDGNKGPNTGGMATFAPVPGFTQERFVRDRVISPVLEGLRRMGRPFVGCLYPGLKGSSVLEYNARFGDPETQVYMRLLKTDILEIFKACVEGRLHEIKVEWHPGYAVCIVLVSEGYPSPDYRRDVPIIGIDRAESLPGVVVFHAGTTDEGGLLKTSGGRVLGVTAIGVTLREAIENAYRAVECIYFEGMHYRKDVGLGLI